MESRQAFTPEQVRKLKEHPYVENATEWTVRFTSEFKRIAYDEYHNGKSMKKIFAEAGLNVEELGDGRIQNFRNKLCRKAEQDNNFADGRKNNSRKEAQSTEAQLAKKIRELEHRNAYLEQENDFLKKIQALEEDCAGKAGKQR